MNLLRRMRVTSVSKAIMLICFILFTCFVYEGCDISDYSGEEDEQTASVSIAPQPPADAVKDKKTVCMIERGYNLLKYGEERVAFETQFEYDMFGNCTYKKRSYIDGSWDSSTEKYNDKNYRVASYSNGSDGSTGRIKVSYNWTDEYHVLVSRSATGRGSNKIKDTSLTYDEEGRIIEESFSGGGIIYYSYDEKGNLIREKYESQDPQKSYIVVCEYNSLGDIIRRENKKNDEVTVEEYKYKYSDMKKEKSIYKDGIECEKYIYFLDEKGKVVKEEQWFYEEEKEPRKNVLEYDDFGNTIKIERFSGDKKESSWKYEYEYKEIEIYLYPRHPSELSPYVD